MKAALEGKIKEVKVSTRLKGPPRLPVGGGPLSIEMEKVLSRQPGSEDVKSDKVLEINAGHPVFAVLKAAQEAGDTGKVNQYSQILYAQAQLIEGPAGGRPRRLRRRRLRPHEITGRTGLEIFRSLIRKP